MTLENDFLVEEHLSFGDWLYQEIADEVVIESSGFFVDQVERVSARLQRGRPPRGNGCK